MPINVNTFADNLTCLIVRSISPFVGDANIKCFTGAFRNSSYRKQRFKVGECTSYLYLSSNVLSLFVEFFISTRLLSLSFVFANR